MAVRIELPGQYAERLATLHDREQQSASFGVAFVEDGAEAAVDRRPPEEGRRLDPRGKPRIVAHRPGPPERPAPSGRVAFIDSHQHSGKGVAAARAA